MQLLEDFFEHRAWVAALMISDRFPQYRHKINKPYFRRIDS
jgi:hypothetical protein